MNVPVPDRVASRETTGRVPHRVLTVLAAATLVLTGCSSITSKLAMPEFLTVPDIRDFRITPNTSDFENRFYAGASFGSTTLSPDTSAAPVFSADDTSAGASQLRFGYDLHNRLALEVDSSVLGEAGVNEASNASIKYTSLAGSALFYALSGNENRNRRENWSGFGRLGVALNRTASNIGPLDNSDTDIMAGIGVEYGMKNGLGIRGEVTRFSSDATFLGLGLIYRFNSVKRFLPEHLAKREEGPAQVASRFEGAENGAAEQTAVLPGATYTRRAQGGTAATTGAVRVLASASDHDVDGVPNASDKCAATRPGTAVDVNGCGLFDGVLANSTFASGSAGLSPEVKASLDNLATRLIAFPEVRIAIEGHTDDKGPSDINLNVSRARAHMVRDYLIRKGVAPRQLETHAYGEQQPVADNSTEQGRDLNRRIAFVTLPGLSADQISAPAAETMYAASEVKKAPPRRVASATVSSADNEPVLAAARPAIDLLPPTAHIPGLNTRTVMDSVGFETQSAKLKAGSLSAIDRVARVLRQYPHIRVMVAAHTNEFDSEQENLVLSRDQARAVTRELVQRGVDRRQLVARGFGSSLPRVQEVSELDRVTNRRIELRPVRGR